MLVVDDQEIIRAFCCEVLKRIGLTTFAAEDGLAGVAVFKAHKDSIGLVILDLVMPRMSGAAAFTAFRAVDPRIPIILISGYGLEGDPASTLARDCNGFLQKPFSAAELSRKVLEALSKEKTCG